MVQGSSPLARGLQRILLQVQKHVRIIPARAGFTTIAGPPIALTQDHPRSRGVYCVRVDEYLSVLGSSPLARGLPSRRTRQAKTIRIIPARAGFTSDASERRAAGWDHPRSRGVYNLAWDEMMDGWGSSPLARGLLVRRRAAAPIRRIIPARAGFTGRGSPSYLDSGDHPRSRGVYGGHTYTVQQTEGSSPLARGLPRRPWTSRTGRRIIPARAGFTHCPGRASSPRPDHPRSRGVYSAIRHQWIGFAGSSPLARGLHSTVPGIVIRDRIIPARAGFTTTPHESFRGMADHPRSRGVYKPTCNDITILIGSSPLARGLPWHTATPRKD